MELLEKGTSLEDGFYFNHLQLVLAVDLSPLGRVPRTDNPGIGDPCLQKFKEANSRPDVDVLDCEGTQFEEVLLKFVIVDFVVVGLQGLEQFLGQLLLVLERVLGQQKGESQGPEMDQACRGGLLVEDLVVLIDSRFEGGVCTNQSKQLRVLVVVGADAAIEEDVTTHLSYIIILKPGLRSTSITGQRTGRSGLEGRGRGNRGDFDLYNI